MLTGIPSWVPRTIIQFYPDPDYMLKFGKPPIDSEWES